MRLLMWTPAEHLDNYIEFARAEKWTSGPGPHRKVAEVLARGSSDPAWAIGLYGMAYTTAGMEVLLHHLPDRDTYFSRTSIENLWSLVPYRDERRVNGFGPQRLYEMLVSYQDWLPDGLERAQSADSFDEAFRLTGGLLKHFGRFFGIKLYEALERTVGLPHFDDIRPCNGAWARRTLQLFFPTHDPYDNGKLSLDLAKGYATVVQDAAFDKGVDLSTFEVESMLCNYRQMTNGKKYAGGDVDGDLGYVRRGQALSPELKFQSLAARETLVPLWARGEVQGWEGRREPLDSVMSKHSYVWTDARYVWAESQDLSKPVRWANSERINR